MQVYTAGAERVLINTLKSAIIIHHLILPAPASIPLSESVGELLHLSTIQKASVSNQQALFSGPANWMQKHSERKQAMQNSTNKHTELGLSDIERVN